MTSYIYNIYNHKLNFSFTNYSIIWKANISEITLGLKGNKNWNIREYKKTMTPKQAYIRTYVI